MRLSNVSTESRTDRVIPVYPPHFIAGTEGGGGGGVEIWYPWKGHKYRLVYGFKAWQSKGAILKWKEKPWTFLYARLQTGRIMVWWCPSGSPSVRSPSARSPSARFPHSSPTCFDILSWNFAHDFVLMYYRSSLSVITLRQFLKELCLFVNIEYGKYTVFRSFLLHALTYWAEILHMTLFWCTTEQVRVSFLCVNFLRSYASFWSLEYRKNTVFRSFLPACSDILSWNFAHDFVLIYYRASSSVVTLRQFLKELCFFVDLVYRKYSFPHFSPTCFDILSWNFAHDFVLMYYRLSLSVITLRQFLKELCLFWNLEYRKIHSFPQFSPACSDIIELKFCTWLCFNVLQSKFECCHFASIFEGVKLLCGLSM